MNIVYTIGWFCFSKHIDSEAGHSFINCKYKVVAFKNCNIMFVGKNSAVCRHSWTVYKVYGKSPKMV